MCSHLLEFVNTGLLLRCRLTSLPTSFLYGINDLDNTMGDINNDLGDDALATFPVALCVLLTS
jgi:hypothetical protein